MSTQLALAPAPFSYEETYPMAQRKVQRLSNRNKGQLSEATQTYLIKLLTPEADGGLESWEHYYQVLFKDKIAAADAMNSTHQLHKKLLVQDRLRKRLEAKRR